MSEHEISIDSLSTLLASRLRERTIQLLQLHPGRPNTSLEGTTLEVSLDDPDCPKYEALSYVPGNSDTTVPFLCNGEQVRIPTSLAKALRRIRWGIISPHAVPMRPFEVATGDQLSMPKYIWVDTLCVHQLEAAEGPHKDVLTGEIYSRAERVIVWLHEHDMSKEVLAAVLTALDIVFERLEGSDAQSLTFAEVQAQVEKDARLRTKLDVWKALDAMFSSQWFDFVECTEAFGLAREVTLLYDCVQLAVEPVVGFLRWYEDRVRHETGNPASLRLLRNLCLLDKGQSGPFNTAIMASGAGTF